MQYKMLIDGQWRDASDGGSWSVVNPATETEIASVPFGGAAETTEAIDAAARALPKWRAMTAYDRGAILRDIGFMMVTEIIWSKDGTGGRWGSANAQRPIFGSYPYPPNFLFKNIHECILVYSKPPARKSRGPKVVPYEELMAETGRRT